MARDFVIIGSDEAYMTETLIPKGLSLGVPPPIFIPGMDGPEGGCRCKAARLGSALHHGSNYILTVLAA
jgi:hypothetical protein